MRALVTGGAGFIGSHLVDRLVADGHRVAVLDDLSTGHRNRIPGSVALHVVDVIDARGVTGVVSGYQPDVIYHLAAQISVRSSVTDPAADALINTVGTLNLLGAATATGARLILASTGGAMYGDGVTPRRGPRSNRGSPRPELGSAGMSPWTAPGRLPSSAGFPAPAPRPASGPPTSSSATLPAPPELPPASRAGSLGYPSRDGGREAAG